MDSLDRTNVVQSLIAAENLNSVLKNVGILHNNDVIDNHQGNLFKGMDNKTAKGQLSNFKMSFQIYQKTNGVFSGFLPQTQKTPILKWFLDNEKKVSSFFYSILEARAEIL